MTVSLESVEEGIVQVGSQKLSIDEVKKLAQAADSSLAEAAIALLMLQKGVAVENKEEEVKEEVKKFVTVPDQNVSQYVNSEDVEEFSSNDWPAQDLADGINFLLEKEDISEIARSLGTSITAFINKMRSIGIHINETTGQCEYEGIRNTEWNSDAEDMVVALHNAGLSHVSMAFLLGRSVGSIDSKLWEKDNPDYVKPSYR